MKNTEYVPKQDDSLATQLKRYRLQAGFTQKNVADALNICRSTYTYYELGKTSPDPATLNRIAKMFGVPVEEFFENEISSMQPSMLYDSGARRVSKKVKAEPQRIGDLTTDEKAIIAFLRDKRISPESALDALKENFIVDTERHLY